MPAPGASTPAQHSCGGVGGDQHARLRHVVSSGALTLLCGGGDAAAAPVLLLLHRCCY